MHTGTIPYTLDLGVLGEYDVVVAYSYAPGRPGKMYMPNGDPGYPDEPPEVYVTAVSELPINVSMGLTGDGMNMLIDVLGADDDLLTAICEAEYDNAADARYEAEEMRQEAKRDAFWDEQERIAHLRK